MGTIYFCPRSHHRQIKASPHIQRERGNQTKAKNAQNCHVKQTAHAGDRQFALTKVHNSEGVFSLTFLLSISITYNTLVRTHLHITKGKKKMQPSKTENKIDNSGKGRALRAANHLKSAIILLGGLPQTFWIDDHQADSIQQITMKLRSTEKAIRALEEKTLK